MKIPDIFGLKGVVISLSAGIVLGTFGGGLLVHKVWLGKTQSAAIKTLTAKLETANHAALLSESAKGQATEINGLLRSSLGTLQGTVSTLSTQNATLAASRAPRIETIYRETERQINAIQNLDKCASAVVDERLLNIIWPVKTNH